MKDGGGGDRTSPHAPESADAYLIDFELLLRAQGTDVKFGKFFVGGLSARMPWDPGERGSKCAGQQAREFGDPLTGA